MSRAGMFASLIAVTFVAAEIVRPTHVPPKKIAARALLERSQAVPGGAGNSLDPELLDDLPRIHPDASGVVHVEKRGDGSFVLTGTASDPYDGSAGAAVFIESDGSSPRIGTATARYGAPPSPHAFRIFVQPATLGRGTHRLYVAMISADRRGFFILPDPIVVTVD